jgi:hypothetical protein
MIDEIGREWMGDRTNDAPAAEAGRYMQPARAGKAMLYSTPNTPASYLGREWDSSDTRPYVTDMIWSNFGGRAVIAHTSGGGTKGPDWVTPSGSNEAWSDGSVKWYEWQADALPGNQYRAIATGLLGEAWANENSNFFYARPALGY